MRGAKKIETCAEQKPAAVLLIQKGELLLYDPAKLTHLRVFSWEGVLDRFRFKVKRILSLPSLSVD